MFVAFSIRYGMEKGDDLIILLFMFALEHTFRTFEVNQEDCN